jgi:hypothetical protein
VWLCGRTWDAAATSGSTTAPETIPSDVPARASAAGELGRPAEDLVRAAAIEEAIVRSPTPPLVVAGSTGSDADPRCGAVVPALTGGLLISCGPLAGMSGVLGGIG